MSRLRCGAIVLAYNQEDYVEYCLRSLCPHVGAGSFAFIARRKQTEETEHACE